MAASVPSLLSASESSERVAHQGVRYLSGSHLVPVGVHGGQDVDACVVDQPHDPMVSCSVLLAEKLA